MTTLPVSGVALTVRPPGSADELLVLESELPPAMVVLELARRVARQADGSAVDVDALPACEIGGLALAIRQAWIGDLLTTDGHCAEAGCGERVDVSFRLGEYAAHVRPTLPTGVEEAAGGWYRLRGEDVSFRVPTVADLVGALSGADGATTLTASCVRPTELDDDQWARVDDALDEISPHFDGVVGGRCPHCGATLQLHFDPCSYVTAELKDLFAGLYYEVHLLATAYGWAEVDILGMERGRRIRYAHLVAQEQATR